jgi:hypothetical protein
MKLSEKIQKIQNSGIVISPFFELMEIIEINRIISNIEDLKLFFEWVHFDNVIQFNENLFGAQCNQYKIKMSVENLAKYFTKNYL